MISSIHCTSFHRMHHENMKNSEMNHHQSFLSRNFKFTDETENLIDNDDYDQQRKFRSRNKDESTNVLTTKSSIIESPQSSSSFTFSDSLSQHNSLNNDDDEMKILYFVMNGILPKCTVLHRCDEESGCCEDVTHRCEPSKTQLIELYFHVIRSDIKNNITGGNAVGIERLTFLNHTHCECKPINYMPRSVQIRPPLRLMSSDGGQQQGHPYHHHRHHHHNHHHKCKHVIKCPEPFIQRFRGSDQRYGFEKFDPFQSKCIQNGECSEPICSFGLRFNRTESQCLTPQKSGIWSNYNHNNHQLLQTSLHSSSNNHHQQQQQQQHRHDLQYHNHRYGYHHSRTTFISSEQQQQQKCPKECSNNEQYSPVCSSNGTVFDNECSMHLLSNCSLNISDWEECRGLHPLCPADCLDIQDPVCADDNKIYPNKCVMHKRNCGKLIRERPILFCLGNNARKSRQDHCPDNCLELYKPVCGSDGQVYLNECYLKMQNCDNGIEKVDMNECATASKCPAYCIPIYDPVCGSNKKIYLNQCMMLKENCNATIKNMPLQFCVGDDVDKL
ncbi:hypothetical protein DERP_004460 [Dermatophagoides pteronyssinus]|uniref:Agrin-like n=1 Tax=Dermatophagoides pteronyssinus TaxID=6956 RepID=A0ABQ8JPE9_DERPT|nr:hypothetical protein DERP_004460 [Dermatophagoides pteronyssinus]